MQESDIGGGNKSQVAQTCAVRMSAVEQRAVEKPGNWLCSIKSAEFSGSEKQPLAPEPNSMPVSADMPKTHVCAAHGVQVVEGDVLVVCYCSERSCRAEIK